MKNHDFFLVHTTDVLQVRNFLCFGIRRLRTNERERERERRRARW